jgi:hypothetical protein
MGMTALRVTALAFPLFAAANLYLRAADKPRVFITESHPIQISGQATDGVTPFLVSGGTSPENVEVMKSFVALCPGVVVTSNREKGSYVVRLDHEGVNPTTPFTHGNKVAVFNQNEDLIYSGSTRLLRASVKAACAAIAAAEQK